jgi:hypothetical protein
MSLLAKRTSRLQIISGALAQVIFLRMALRQLHVAETALFRVPRTVHKVWSRIHPSMQESRSNH